MSIKSIDELLRLFCVRLIGYPPAFVAADGALED